MRSVKPFVPWHLQVVSKLEIVFLKTCTRSNFIFCLFVWKRGIFSKKVDIVGSFTPLVGLFGGNFKADRCLDLIESFKEYLLDSWCNYGIFTLILLGSLLDIFNVESIFCMVVYVECYFSFSWGLETSLKMAPKVRC